MTQSQEMHMYATDADIIKEYEQELEEQAKKATVKESIAKQGLHDALFSEYGANIDGAEVILGDQ